MSCLGTAGKRPSAQTISVKHIVDAGPELRMVAP